MHPTKTKIVYCKDQSRTGTYANVTFDFLGYQFRPRRVVNPRDASVFLGFTPAVSPSSLKSMRETIRELDLRRRTHVPMDKLAEQLNPILRGWIDYYGRFTPSALAPLYRYVNQTVRAWVRRKFRRYAYVTRATRLLQRVAETRVDLFVHWSKPGGMFV